MLTSFSPDRDDPLKFSLSVEISISLTFDLWKAISPISLKLEYLRFLSKISNQNILLHVDNKYIFNNQKNYVNFFHSTIDNPLKFSRSLEILSRLHQNQ
jgi:hypothetical protein